MRRKGRTRELTQQITLVKLTCRNCGILFAVQDSFDEQRRRDQATYFCPAGHRQNHPKPQPPPQPVQSARPQPRPAVSTADDFMNEIGIGVEDDGGALIGLSGSGLLDLSQR
jgi:hypothetical protein